MTPAQQAALEALKGRALQTGEVQQIDALITPLGRDDAGIAAVLGTRPPVLVSMPVRRQGVAQLCGDVNGGAFLALLDSLHAARAQGSVPAWLTTVLTAIGRPVQTHAHTLYTMGEATLMLSMETGIDLGLQATRDNLTLIKMGNASNAYIAAACDALLAAPFRSHPITPREVTDALNAVEG